MKPCSRNRKLLAWLAVDELDAAETEALRAHIEQCEGCRIYYESLASLYAGQRAAIEKKTEAEPSFALHHGLMSRIRKEEHRLQLEKKASPGWVKAGAVAAGVALAVIVMVALAKSAVEKSRMERQAKHRPVQTLTSEPKEFQPSIAGYRKSAGKSLENLDALLNKEGRKNPDNGQSLDLTSLLQ